MQIIFTHFRYVAVTTCKSTSHFTIRMISSFVRSIFFEMLSGTNELLQCCQMNISKIHKNNIITSMFKKLRLAWNFWNRKKWVNYNILYWVSCSLKRVVFCFFFLYKEFLHSWNFKAFIISFYFFTMKSSKTAKFLNHLLTCYWWWGYHEKSVGQVKEESKNRKSYTIIGNLYVCAWEPEYLYKSKIVVLEKRS